MFGFATPGTVDGGDGSGIEVGVKFQLVDARRGHGHSVLQGRHEHGHAHRQPVAAFGTRLATATFTNESSSGWQTVTFSSPVTITPDTTYIASYYAPSGHYSVNGPGLASAVTDAPLTALADATSQNGVYAYGGASAFPSSSYNASNYWVDVLYAPLADPGPVTGVTATAGPATPPCRGPPERWHAGRQLQDHALRRHDGPAVDDDQRAGDEYDDHRADAGHELHVQGPGPQHRRLGPDLGRIQRGDADVQRRARRPDRRRRGTGDKLGARDVDRPAARSPATR